MKPIPVSTWQMRLSNLLHNDRALALLIFAISAGIYLPTLSPSVVVGDGGELQMLAQRLGISHPTGYPLLLLAGGLFSRLPLGGDPAYRLSLFCMLCAAGAVALLYRLTRQAGAGRAAAAAAALLLGFAPRLWMHASATEVYPLASFFILLVAWLFLRWSAGQSPLWLATLAFGFGLTHHINMRLLAPAVLLHVLLVQPRLIVHPRRWLPALGTLLAPLSLYALIPLRAAQFAALPEWSGRILGVRQLVASGLISPHFFAGNWLSYILAMDYNRQITSLANIGLSTLRQFSDMLALQFPLMPLAVALSALGLIVLLRRRTREGILLLAIYAITLFAALKFLADVGEDGDHFIPAFLMMTVWISVGVQTLCDALRRWLPGKAWAPALLLVAFAGLPLANLIEQYPQALERRQMDLAAQARQALGEPLPAGAVLAGAWIDVTPLRYMQQVEHLRPDLWIIATDANGTRVLAERAMEQSQPFYVLRSTPNGPKPLPLPFRQQDAISQPADVALNAAVRWRGFDLSSTELWRGETLQVILYWQANATPAEDWTTFLQVLGEGDAMIAQEDRLPVGTFYPPSQWPAGHWYADAYELSLPVDLPAGSYRLIFGAYTEAAGRLTWADGRDVHQLAELTLTP